MVENADEISKYFADLLHFRTWNVQIIVGQCSQILFLPIELPPPAVCVQSADEWYLERGICVAINETFPALMTMVIDTKYFAENIPLTSSPLYLPQCD